MAERLRNIIDAGWAEALEPVADRIAAMGEFLRAEVAAGRRYLPSGENVLRAFKQPLADVRVLIVGQDPYPTPGHPVGLSFSVAPGAYAVHTTPGSEKLHAAKDANNKDALERAFAILDEDQKATARKLLEARGITAPGTAAKPKPPSDDGVPLEQ